MRDQLSQDERTLLILRIDRGLSWSEVAVVLLGPNGDMDEEAIGREAAACRKRFERVKARLRKMADAAGLLERDG